MHSLLADAAGPGYPADYLLARLQGRRPPLASASAPALSTAGAGLADRDDSRYWQEAAAERSWLFRQLGFELRATLAPLFVHFELGTLARVFRYLEGQRPGEADRVLQASLLSPTIRTILRGREGVAGILSHLERSPACLALSLAGISERYTKGGLQRCEEFMRSRFLARVLADGGQRDLVFFFGAVTDIRNMLTVAKALRWGVDPVPPLVAGGQVPALRPAGKVTPEALARMVRRWTHGLSLAGDQLRPENLEPVLQEYLLRFVTRRRWQGGIVAACIEYVWRSYSHARECSLRLHSAEEGGR